MSILRSKAYHTVTATYNSLNYVVNADKTAIDDIDDGFYSGGLTDSELGKNVSNAFKYSVNPNKTVKINEDGEKETLVSGVNCKPDTAEMQFKADMQRYYDSGHTEPLAKVKGKRLVIVEVDDNGQPVLDKTGNYIRKEKTDKHALPLRYKNGKCVYEEYDYTKQARASYMWVLSFGGEKEWGYNVDPRLAHQIGIEFCKQFLGDYRCVVATHLNTDHVHNHIVANAYPMDPIHGHKYVDTMATLMQARAISDNLSLQYGLPIIIDAEKDKNKEMGWYEWQLRQKGKSYKAQMEKDIKAAIDASDSYDDFVDTMTMAGYRLRQTDHHITYCMPTGDIRCRDTKLGDDFLKDNIIKYYTDKEKTKNKEIKDIKKTDDIQIVQHKKINVYVARYTTTGRRRTDLELLLLKAIKILQAVKDYYNDSTIPKKIKSLNPVIMPADWKIQQLQDTLKIVQDYQYNNIADLERDLIVTGGELSQVKAEIKRMSDGVAPKQKILQQITDAMDYLVLMDKYGYKTDDLQIYHYKAEDIKKGQVKISPMTPSQKRQLFVALDKSAYTVDAKYDDITYDDAQECIDYLKGRTENKPEILSDKTITSTSRLTAKYDKIYETRIQGLQNRYGTEKIIPYQDKQLSQLFASTDNHVREQVAKLGDIEIDTDKMSRYDAMRVIAFLSDTNKMDSPIVDNQVLNNLCKEHNLYPIRQIATDNDIKDINDYVARGCKKPLPGILDTDKPSDIQIKQIKELLQIKNDKTAIEPEDMSKKEYYDLYNYLINKDHIPEMIDVTLDTITIRQGQDTLFTDFAGTTNSPELLYQTRDVLNELAKIGINPDNIADKKMEIEAEIKNFDTIKGKESELKDKYKELSRVKYNINLSQNKMYTYGPRYKEPKEEKDVINEVEHCNKEQEQQEKQQESQEQSKSKGYKDRDIYFDSL